MHQALWIWAMRQIKKRGVLSNELNNFEIDGLLSIRRLQLHANKKKNSNSESNLLKGA